MSLIAVDNCDVPVEANDLIVVQYEGGWNGGTLNIDPKNKVYRLFVESPFSNSSLSELQDVAFVTQCGYDDDHGHRYDWERHSLRFTVMGFEVNLHGAIEHGRYKGKIFALEVGESPKEVKLPKKLFGGSLLIRQEDLKQVKVCNDGKINLDLFNKSYRYFSITEGSSALHEYHVKGVYTNGEIIFTDGQTLSNLLTTNTIYAIGE